ncbi:MAG: SNF2 helicase associated domain-containing protein [Terrisporobacter sp.]
MSQSRNGNLGGNLNIEGVDKLEYANIFQSYKDNYKYHLMTDGSYIDLKDNDLQKIFQLIDVFGVYGDFNED